MSYALSLATKTKAQSLAQALFLSPQGRHRVKPTERIWRYRTYQGGDSIITIDWRQSARSRELVVREHEPLSSRKVFFWAPMETTPASLQEKLALLFLSLGRLLIQGERTIGWLGLDQPETNTSSQVDALFERGFSDNANLPAPCSLRSAILIVALDSSAMTKPFYDALRTFSAQGNQCLLLDINAKAHEESSVIYRKSWPVLSMGSERPLDALLPLLLDEIIRLSR
ncbi:MAG: DUF58 domain-containing protein [Bdellovibrionales bacterium]|jgi:hypothetical protein